MDKIPVVIAVPVMQGWAEEVLSIIQRAYAKHGDNLVVVKEKHPADEALADEIADKFNVRHHNPWKVVSLLRELMTLRWAKANPGPFALVDWDELPVVGMDEVWQHCKEKFDFVYRGAHVPLFFSSAEPLQRFWGWLMEVEPSALPANLNEMLLWGAFYEANKVSAIYINSVLGNRLFYGANPAEPEGMEKEEVKSEDGRQYQRIFWHGNTPFVCKPPDTLIPMAVLHCWGCFRPRVRELAERAGLL